MDFRGVWGVLFLWQNQHTTRQRLVIFAISWYHCDTIYLFAKEFISIMYIYIYTMIWYSIYVYRDRSNVLATHICSRPILCCSHLFPIIPLYLKNEILHDIFPYCPWSFLPHVRMKPPWSHLSYQAGKKAMELLNIATTASAAKGSRRFPRRSAMAADGQRKEASYNEAKKGCGCRTTLEDYPTYHFGI